MRVCTITLTTRKTLPALVVIVEPIVAAPECVFVWFYRRFAVEKVAARAQGWDTRVIFRLEISIQDYIQD